MSSLFWAVIFRALDAFFRGIVLHVLRFFGEALVQKTARVFGEIMGAGAKVVAKAGLSLSLACMLSVLPVVNSPALATSGAESSAENLTATLPAGLYTRAVMDEIEEDADFNYVRLGKIAGLAIFPKGYTSVKGLVDKVVVYKMRHQMLLLKNDRVVRSYWIALSDRPEGDKVREGDRRTPEGVYTLDYVKENSYYYRAFHISYPNLKDIEEARRLGVRPGGMIMVHGQPPSNSEYHETVQRSDWTNGCIAILNPEIDEFISLVDPGTPIEILP